MEILNRIAQIIYNKKGFNIIALDLQGISSITDYMIIASGNIERHINAISQEIIMELKKEGETPLYVEGARVGDWIILDYGWFHVHLFIPECREKYRLENLWQEAKIIDLEIEVSKEA